MADRLSCAAHWQMLPQLPWRRPECENLEEITKRNCIYATLLSLGGPVASFGELQSSTSSCTTCTAFL